MEPAITADSFEATRPLSESSGFDLDLNLNLKTRVLILILYS
jgi:hypothetical protein